MTYATVNSNTLFHACERWFIGYRELDVESQHKIAGDTYNTVRYLWILSKHGSGGVRVTKDDAWVLETLE